MRFARAGSGTARAVLAVRRRQGRGVPRSRQTTQTNRRPHNGKRTRLCQRNEDRLFRIPRDDEPHRPHPHREERGQKIPAQPDYRIFAGDIETEIGGGWIVRAKSSGREYISLTLADPQIGPRNIYANLAPVKGKKGRYVLLWNAKE